MEDNFKKATRMIIDLQNKNADMAVILEKVVGAASNLIKYNEEPSVGGMTEVSTEGVKELDAALHEFDSLVRVVTTNFN